MDVTRKLTILADAAKYDASCASSGSQRERAAGGMGNTQRVGICHSYTPDGRCVSLLKILLTNVCVFDCLYCVNRTSSDVPRARFTVREVVDLTLDFYRRNYIEGLFLSSGIIQAPDYTMEQLVEVARRLRLDHRFGGYIHLKTIPGASDVLVEEAGRYADRLSVNIELPTPAGLQALAPQKTHPTIEHGMALVRQGVDEARRETRAARRVSSVRRTPAPAFAPAGQSTQMIVGASGDSDRDAISTASHLYRTHGLRRVYYSAFSPFPLADRRLPVTPPSLVREHRLYQSDWLLRYYGFAADELVTDADDNLPLAHDPKTAWALAHRAYFPVDVNTAPREALLRVPGLGVRTVNQLIGIRRHHRIHLSDLAKLRVSVRRIRPFVVTADSTPRLLDSDGSRLSDLVAAKPAQLTLTFPEANAS